MTYGYATSLQNIPTSLIYIPLSIFSFSFAALFLSPLLSPLGSFYGHNPWLVGLGTGRHLEYQSYLGEVDHVPAPLLFISLLNVLQVMGLGKSL